MTMANTKTAKTIEHAVASENQAAATSIADPAYLAGLKETIRSWNSGHVSARMADAVPDELAEVVGGQFCNQD